MAQGSHGTEVWVAIPKFKPYIEKEAESIPPTETAYSLRIHLTEKNVKCHTQFMSYLDFMSFQYMTMRGLNNKMSWMF